MTDEQWWAQAEQRYEECWRKFIGSPESFANGANWLYHNQEFGAAALMYQKAIDLLHTLYCFSTGRRQPSSADLPITDGYSSSLGATLSLHPGAPVSGSITEVAHRLTDIFFTCKRADLPAGLYGNALIDLAPTARRYGVFIDPAAFTDPRGTVINNQGGVIATGTNIAVAYGKGARADVTGGAAAASTDQILELLRHFVSELPQSRRADTAELATTAGEIGRELTGPAPRKTTLKILASGLAAVVRGAGPLADLALRIEQAIHGL